MAKPTFLHPGSIREGYFCPDCCTPTVIVIPYFWLTEDGVTTAPAKTMCTRCQKSFLQLERHHDGAQ